MSKRLKSSDRLSAAERGVLQIRKCINCLPPEVLQEVFRYVTNHELCLSVRRVSKKWKTLCESVVNRNFLRLQSRIQKDITNISQSIKDDSIKKEQRILLCLGRDYMEHVQIDYEMTLAVVWRYCYYFQPLANMFGGKLVDMIDKYVTTEPTNRTNDGIVCIRATARSFLDFFQDHIEKKLNDDWTVSGAKLLDILDCLLEKVKSKEILEEEINDKSGNYRLRCIYTIHGSWFCSLDDKKQRTYRNHFRNMAHTLRRLVTKRNFYVLYDFQRARQKQIFNDYFSPAKNYSYTGFQHFGSISYGCMNRLEYQNRTQFNVLLDEEQQSEGEDEQQSEGEAEEDEIDEELHEPEYITPMMSVRINALLSCPIEVAPKRILRKSPPKIFRTRSKLFSSQKFYLKLQFFCESSSTSKLPSFYEWSSNISNETRSSPVLLG